MARTKESAAAAARKWRAKNRDKHREACRKWVEKNREKKRQMNAEWAKAHPEVIRRIKRECAKRIYDRKILESLKPLRPKLASQRKEAREAMAKGYTGTINLERR